MTTTDNVVTVALIALALLTIEPLATKRAPTGAHMATVVAALASFLWEPSVMATVVALPWVVSAAVHAWRRPGLPALWAVAAGGWLLAHRSGIDPLAVGHGITLLTVAHFLVAGCGLTALMIAVGERSGHRFGPVAAHQVGMVCVAFGILVGGWLEPVGASLIIGALAVHSVRAWRTDVGSRRWLLRISALAWTSPMVLAMLWALRTHLPRPVVGSIATMLTHHGAVNAVAVVLAGLGACRVSTGRTVRNERERSTCHT